MKKNILLMFVQYILAVLMVAASVLYVFAFDAGVLPFMDDDYLLSAQTPAVSEPTPPPPVDEEEEIVVTADVFAASLPQRNGALYTGIYNGTECKIVNIPISPLGVIGNGSLRLHMGYIFKLDENVSVVSVYSSEPGLPDVSEIFESNPVQNLRDGEGRVVFYSGDVYSYLEKGKLVPTEYDSLNYDKGVNYYPSYLAGGDSDYKLFTESGCWGVKSASGKVIVPPQYKDVYGASEGRIIAIGFSGGVYIYNTKGQLLSDDTSKYEIPEDVELVVESGDDLPVVGCYFYRNGLTRVYNSEGESVMLTVDCKEIEYPTGFQVVAYSDGAVLLKQSRDGKEDLYGYMSAEGDWISNPDYIAARPFYEGLAAVCGADGKWGMIDTEGNVVIPMLFDSVSDCQDGVILAYEKKFGNCIFGKTVK